MSIIQWDNFGEKLDVSQRNNIVLGHSRHRIVKCFCELAKVHTRIKLSEEIGVTAFTLASTFCVDITSLGCLFLFF